MTGKAALAERWVRVQEAIEATGHDRIIVVAYTYRDAAIWASEHGLRTNQWRPVTRYGDAVRVLQGTRGAPVVLTNRAYRIGGMAEIAALMTHREAVEVPA